MHPPDGPALASVQLDLYKQGLCARGCANTAGAAPHVGARSTAFCQMFLPTDRATARVTNPPHGRAL